MFQKPQSLNGLPDLTRWRICCSVLGLHCSPWEPAGRVFSVSWIRHLGTACGEMFIVGCSHNLPSTAELPSANRPGDRTDRFRPTCHTFLREICVWILDVFVKNVLPPKEVSSDWSTDRVILSAMLTRARAYGFIYLCARVL